MQHNKDMHVFKERFVVIKSPMGTGKTKSFTKFMQYMQSQAPSIRFLSIVSRKSLAQEHHNNFYKDGLENVLYTDIDDAKKFINENIVIQLDSIQRLWSIQHRLSEYVVFLDEFHSILTHLSYLFALTFLTILLLYLHYL